MIGANTQNLSDVVVGDRFWLSYAQDAVRGAIAGPEARATQLAGAIAWFWTVYSSVGILVAVFAPENVSSLASIFVGAPSFILIIAYWYAVRVGRPMLFTFDPRVPAEIANAYAQAAKEKHATLKKAERWTASAGACVTIGFGIALLSNDGHSTSLAARFDPVDSTRILVNASVPRNVIVTFVAQAASGAAGQLLAVSAIERASPDGTARSTLRVASRSAYRVSASWTDKTGNLVHSVAANVSAE